MISLIAKKRLLEFIKAAPEAKVPLLLWLKEDIVNRRMEFNHDEPSQTTCQLSASQYKIDLQIRASLQVALIKWLGTEEEAKALSRQKLERLRAEHSEEFDEQMIETKVFISSPPPIDLSDEDPGGPDVSLNDSEWPSFYENETPQDFQKIAITEAEYDKALERAMEIFDAPVGTAAYEELAGLIPVIKSYEAQFIQLPQLDITSAVKLRLKEFNIFPEELAHIATKEELEEFLSGGRMLEKAKLKALLNMLALRYRV